MPARIQSLPMTFGPAYIRAAEVIQAVSGTICRVRMEGLAREEISAVVATAVPVALEPGDRVLVAGENPTSGYIIGVLSTARPHAIRTDLGAGARVQGEGGAQSIAVHDAGGQTVFEYFPASGQSVLRAPEGDLRLSAPRGRIAIEAGRGIQCASPAAVSIHSDQSVSLAAGGRAGGADQNLVMNGDGAHLGVHAVAVTAGEGDVRIGRAVYHGRQLRSEIYRAKMVYGRLEISAQRIWERTETVIRHVAELCQLQAGRLRTLVRGAHHMQCERASITAKEEVRIDGSKINLG